MWCNLNTRFNWEFINVFFEKQKKLGIRIKKSHSIEPIIDPNHL